MAERADIDRIRETVDLVDLISEVTKVKKSGRTFMAVCPFHEEKTPSMSIDRARGLYHCFGCGKGGDLFSFVQETQGLNFADSLEMLARKAGVTLTRNPGDAERRGRRGAAVDAIRQAIEVYHERLKKSPEAGPARAYLRSRDYDIDVIDQWKIGFAGTNWDTLTKELRASGIDEKAIVDGGLGRKGKHGLYDFFRGRLMFPIHDLRGDPVGFGGRKVEQVPRESTNNPDAKYVNSPDSIVYQKSRLLFGLDRARSEIASTGQAVIVEGYTDVIAMHLAGVRSAVATCGTALGDGHFDLLRRFSERVVLAFDSDAAGSKAALRGDELESPFRLDLDLRVAAMPDGLDPADLVQEGRGDELAEAVAGAKPLLEFRIRHEIEAFDLTGPEGRARALHAAVQQLARVQDDIARREYARFVAREVGVDLATVEQALRPGGGRPGTPQTSRQRPLNRAEAELLRVALATPAELKELAATDFTDERLRSAFEAIAEQMTSAAPGVQIDIGRIEDPAAEEILRRLAMDRRPLPDGAEMLQRMRLRRFDVEIEILEADLAQLEVGSQSHSDALRRLIALQQQKRSSPAQ
ncbi:MAG: DNA primase [Acidimicrobiia bacterium]|nr:DNA primase [Acidimicrobiia bacterium]